MEKVEARVPEYADASDGDGYGVDALVDGGVRLRLGTLTAADGETQVRVAPFEIPHDEAIKLAALMLKKAGCKVTIGGGVITARFKRMGKIN